MTRLRLVAAGVLALCGGAVAAEPDPLDPLTTAVADAQRDAAALAEHAATAPPASLKAPVVEETATLAAVVAADDALVELSHGWPAALQRDTSVALLGNLDGAHDDLLAYEDARRRGDRAAMKTAARQALQRLADAAALLDADKRALPGTSGP